MCWKYACTADTGQQIPLADPRDRQSTAFLQLEARYRLNLILPDQPTMPPVSPQELENIREAIAKAQEMKRQREIQKVEHKRQYNRGRYWTLKTGESEREKKQRVDDSLTDMGVDPVALGLSNDAAAVMASMANGVASFIHGRHGRCYLMPQRRDPEDVERRETCDPRLARPRRVGHRAQHRGQKRHRQHSHRVGQQRHVR